jgi:GNAT superfamily N-acetyltransferase
MPTIRIATAADAGLIAEQRRQMFLDAGQTQVADMPELRTNFLAWVRPRLEDGTYLGWLVEEDGAVVGGAGMWLMDFPPHFMDPEPVRAYLLNFYVEPAFRGRGLAVALLRLTVAEAARRNIRVVTLHASKFGRPIYERNGFVDSNEMRLQLPQAPA